VPLLDLLDRLLAALGVTEEERQHRGAEREPLGGVGIDRDRTADHSEDEQRGDRHHIDDHEALEDLRVDDGGYPIQRDEAGDARRDVHERDHDRDHRERRGRQALRQLAAAIGRRRFSGC
jgi:hypothetical protein